LLNNDPVVCGGKRWAIVGDPDQMVRMEIMETDNNDFIFLDGEELKGLYLYKVDLEKAVDLVCTGCGRESGFVPTMEYRGDLTNIAEKCSECGGRVVIDEKTAP